MILITNKIFYWDDWNENARKLSQLLNFVQNCLNTVNDEYIINEEDKSEDIKSVSKKRNTAVSIRD